MSLSMCEGILFMSSRYPVIWEYTVNAQLIWLRDKYPEKFFMFWGKSCEEHNSSEWKLVNEIKSPEDGNVTKEKQTE